MKTISLLCALFLSGCTIGRPSVSCETLVRIESKPMKASYGEILKIAGVSDSAALEQCLIERITSTIPTKDPREAPPYPFYVEGDNAFFTLALKHGWEIRDLLGQPFHSQWAEIGVYAYFDFVQIEGNRRKLQTRVRQLIGERD